MDDSDTAALLWVHTIPVPQPGCTAVPVERLSHMTVVLQGNRTSSSIFAFVVCWINEIYFSKVPTAVTDKAERKYPEWKWETYCFDAFFPDYCLLQKETWNFNFCLWRNYFSSKISYLLISVSSLISFCLSWHKEIGSTGSAQDRGASVFSAGDMFHSVLLSLIVDVPWNMKSIISVKFQWCIWGQNSKFQVQHHAGII